MTIERPETITVQFRTDLLYAMMNVLDVAIGEGTALDMAGDGMIHYATFRAADQGLNDLVTSVNESFGEDVWVDWGVAVPLAA
jgi:hypothetical protein